jgi:hypothetical protein
LTKDTVPPVKISHITLHDVPNDIGGKVAVGWKYSEPADMAEYVIYYGYENFSDTAGATGIITGLQKGATYYEVTGLTVDKKPYYFAIVPVDTNNQSYTSGLTVEGPVYAVNNIIGVRGDWIIESEFDPDVRVEVTPNTNVGKCINIERPDSDSAKASFIDSANSKAKTGRKIEGSYVDTLSDSITEFKMLPGQLLDAEVTIVLSYKNKNLDTGRKIEDNLKIYYLDEANSGWISNPGQASRLRINKTISIKTNHFSIYRILPQIQTEDDLSRVSVYPNPCTVGDSRFGPVNGKYIVFKHLTEQAKIRIYTVAGILVFEYDKNDISDEYKWEMENNVNRKAASGVYIYLITNPEETKQKARGKIAIIK